MKRERIEAHEPFGLLLQHVAAILGRQTDQMLQERLGIGLAQYRILILLQDSPGMLQRALGDALGQTEASISRQVKLLQQKGLVVVRTNPRNRRQHLTTITIKGIALATAALETVEAYHAPLVQLGDKQHQHLAQLLQVLHEHICRPNKPYACDRPGLTV